MFLLYQPVDKQLIWYQSPLQSNDVKGDILDIVKIYNVDAYLLLHYKLPPLWGRVAVLIVQHWTVWLPVMSHIRTQVSRTNFG